MTAQLALRDITKSYGHRPVLDRVSISVRPGEHAGLREMEHRMRELEAYRGALVVVSHDRALRRRFTGTQVEMREGRLVA
ncbi:MAG TPA: hypothetical protein VGP70_10160 [Actinomadura sp.]|nr:hypothetical protein [Actinomadura sp.]